MELKNLAYLLLLLIYLAIPFLLSQQKKVRFIFRLKYILPAIIFSGAIFSMLTLRFIEQNIWNFNPDFTTGIAIANIPVEKCLSFLIVPLSSVYIYEWLKIKLEGFNHDNIFVLISLTMLVASAILAYFYRENIYSFFTFFLTAVYLGYTVFRNRFKKNYAYFYIAFALCLVPFTVVSVILNSFPAIIYNSEHIMGFSFIGIPLENIAHLYLMLLITTTIYEYLSERQYY
jgi:lycopene cyclase domain-containing protein